MAGQMERNTIEGQVGEFTQEQIDYIQFQVAQASGATANALTTYINNQLNSQLPPSDIPVGASPFIYTNTQDRPVTVFISQGTVLTIGYARAAGTFFTLNGLLGGAFHLAPGDRLRVTYLVAPVMTLIPF